jgi:hypothetical protein
MRLSRLERSSDGDGLPCPGILGTTDIAIPSTSGGRVAHGFATKPSLLEPQGRVALCGPGALDVALAVEIGRLGHRAFWRQPSSRRGRAWPQPRGVPAARETSVTEYSAECHLCLNVDCRNHLRPHLGIFGDKITELCRRICNRLLAQIDEPRLQLPSCVLRRRQRVGTERRGSRGVGHAAAAPPMSVMKSRRLIQSARLRGRAGYPAR